MIKCCMVVSGSIQELVVVTVVFSFLNSDLEMDGSDLMTFTSGITLQGAASDDRAVIQKSEKLRPENMYNK